MKVQKMNKWKDFKLKKQQMIEIYTNRVKIIHKAKSLIVLIFQQRFITWFW